MRGRETSEPWSELRSESPRIQFKVLSGAHSGYFQDSVQNPSKFPFTIFSEFHHEFCLNFDQNLARISFRSLSVWNPQRLLRIPLRNLSVFCPESYQDSVYIPFRISFRILSEFRSEYSQDFVQSPLRLLLRIFSVLHSESF